MEGFSGDKVPAVLSPSYTDMFERLVKDKDRYPLEDFIDPIDGTFYEQQITEGREFFGEPIKYKDYLSFINFAGSPHIGRDQEIPTKEYLELHNQKFGTNLSAESFDETMLPHHVVWLISKNHPFSWEHMKSLEPNEQHELLAAYAQLIEKDRNVISAATNTQALVNIALGFLPKSSGLKAAQSREAIHVHVLPPPKPDLEDSKVLIDTTKDILDYDLDNKYSKIIQKHYSEMAVDIVHAAFKKLYSKDFTLTTAIDESGHFDPYAIELDFPRSISLTETLETLSRIYNYMSTIWEELAADSESEFSAKVPKIAALRKLYKKSKTTPTVPSFNVVTKWNDDGKISHITIKPSQRGPSEGMNKAVLKRVFDDK